MQQPLVSIVIPMFNAERWIGETILSIERQTLPADLIEVIVVDDGSSDSSLETVKQALSLGCAKFDVVALPNNGGPSRTRNVGWQRARADWIQFLDADDLLDPGKLEHQTQFALTAPEDVAVIYSEWQRYVFDGVWAPVPPVFNPNMKEDAIRSLLRSDNFIPLASALLRKSWLRQIGGFDQDCWLIEDVHLAIRLSMAGGRFVPAPAGRALFYYRQGNFASLSRSRRKDFIKGCVRNLRLAEDYWRAARLLTDTRSHFLLAQYESLLHNLAELDQEAHEALLAHIRSLDPRWIPQSNLKMHVASRLIGYRRAERLSTVYRKVTANWFRLSSHRLNRQYPDC